MHGMYPNTSNRVRFNARPPMNITDAEKIEEELGAWPIYQDIQPFSIQVE